MVFENQTEYESKYKMCLLFLSRAKITMDYCKADFEML